VLVGGTAAFGAGYLVLALTPRQPPGPRDRPCPRRIGIGCVETAEHAAVAHLAPDSLRGSAFGLVATVQRPGNLAASAVAGVLWTTVSPTAAFVYAAESMSLGARRPCSELGSP
jgi:hypothetical protein